MPKQKLPNPQEEEFYDHLFEDQEYEEEDMISTFGQVADASVEHMKVACKLANMIVRNHTNANEKLSTDDILEIFRKASDTILDCTPLKALFEKA